MAAYGLFDFSSESAFGRYIIDDFTGQFASVVPEPSELLLLLLGLSCLATYKKKFST
ncbi:PEP-CTERM sorting domain-containing protein [Roseateles sp.]|uniref:PEP-CTERM sorting domain-containing protein n=1 Tax=Roseateles sp. TaxID=1971397 RepID=UPI00286AC04A|nr:PEP-CTERM sorting domain-containing protein [Roseateles sp.]